MNTIRTVAVTAAMGCAAVLTSCASSEGSDSQSSAAASPLTTISKAEFVDKGNALCRRNAQAIEPLFAHMSHPPKPAELRAAYEVVLRESYRIVGDVLALGAPPGQAIELVGILVQMQTVTSRVQEMGADAFFADGNDPWKPSVDKLVKDFGLTDCASDD